MFELREEQVCRLPGENPGCLWNREERVGLEPWGRAWDSLPRLMRVRKDLE